MRSSSGWVELYLRDVGSCYCSGQDCLATQACMLGGSYMPGCMGGIFSNFFEASVFVSLLPPTRASGAPAPRQSSSYLVPFGSVSALVYVGYTQSNK